jgi:hypothetical protein
MDALRATYADLKTVKTRGVCQVILEMPIEAMVQVVDMLGAPVAAHEVWVGFARLREGAEQPAIEAQTSRPLSQIAAFHCNKPLFRQFLSEKAGRPIQGPDAAADEVRTRCGIKSRKELDTNSIAARHWRNLKADFEVWMRADDPVEAA